MGLSLDQAGSVIKQAKVTSIADSNGEIDLQQALDVELQQLFASTPSQHYGLSFTDNCLISPRLYLCAMHAAAAEVAKVICDASGFTRLVFCTPISTPQVHNRSEGDSCMLQGLILSQLVLTNR